MIGKKKIHNFIKKQINEIETKSAILKIISMIMDFKLRKSKENMSNRKLKTPVFFIGKKIETPGYPEPNDNNLLSISEFKIKINKLLNNSISDARDLLCHPDVGVPYNNIFNHRGYPIIANNDTHELLKGLDDSLDSMVVKRNSRN